MRRSVTTLEDIKQAVLSLKGEQVELHINRGRRKVFKLEGIIDNVYTSVFTVKDNVASSLTHTYSYSDILCGEVKITKPLQ
ncbi:MAG: Veg family protein [Clostridia bacterium]|nr:Veg family protein [Clostridia bacterium]